MRLQIWQDWSQHDYSTNILQYIKAHIEEWESAHNSCRQYEVKLSRLSIGQTGQTHWHLISRNNKHQICRNMACENQRLAVNIASRSALNQGTTEMSIIFKVICKWFWEGTVKWENWWNSSRKQKCLRRYNLSKRINFEEKNWKDQQV